MQEKQNFQIHFTLSKWDFDINFTRGFQREDVGPEELALNVENMQDEIFIRCVSANFESEDNWSV